MKRALSWWMSGVFNWLSNVEFAMGADVHHRFQPARRLYLKTMRVAHGRHVFVGPHLHVRCRDNLTLGERCAIGSHARIWNYASITIGDDFLSAAGLTINSGGHDIATLEPFSKPVSIGDRVWCGVNVTILAGVTIGDDVVIGAGSVVTEDIPDRAVAVGVPARVVRSLDRDLETLWRPRWS